MKDGFVNLDQKAVEEKYGNRFIELGKIINKPLIIIGSSDVLSNGIRRDQVSSSTKLLIRKCKDISHK